MGKKIIVYQPREQMKMEIMTDGETVWLAQDSGCAKFAYTAADGKTAERNKIGFHP